MYFETEAHLNWAQKHPPASQEEEEGNQFGFQIKCYLGFNITKSELVSQKLGLSCKSMSDLYPQSRELSSGFRSRSANKDIPVSDFISFLGHNFRIWDPIQVFLVPL